MSGPALEALVAFLARPEAYPERPRAVESIETHFSWVFLTDRHAYKLKKPIRYDQLDFSTPALRRHHCEEEVRLNRRLARSVYLGVVAVTQDAAGALALDPQAGGAGAQRGAAERRSDEQAGGAGAQRGAAERRSDERAGGAGAQRGAAERRSDERAAGALAPDPQAGAPVDWLVWMRRLPADRMLDALIAGGEIARDDVRPVAFELAKFFAGAPPVEIAPADYRGRLEAGVRRDRGELCRPELGLARERVTRVAERQLAFLARHAALFDRRVDEQRIVEGHGDLRPEHLCLTPEPAVIDCLEFSRELRIADPADELAFLALECERLGRPDVGRWFLDTYTEVTGDAPPGELLRFHRTYRALRRALIAVWHLDDPTVRDRGDWRAQARGYLALADPPEA